MYNNLLLFTLVTYVSCGFYDNYIGPAIDRVTCTAGFCCNPSYIPADIAGLHSDLQSRLYGQDLVIHTVVNAIRDHWSEDYVPHKALTLSFHGSPGTGKNYVSDFIKKNLFGYDGYIHHFSGRIHFPLERESELYQKNLRDWIRGNVSRCGKQLFVFDEVDKMPPGVLNAIKPMIDYNVRVAGVDFRKTIFIFLSNTGAKRILEEFLRLWNQGVRREDLTMSHFEKIILEGAFNEAGGFQFSDNIKSNLIDHYIPFLPLEYAHVEHCIMDEFKRRNVHSVKQSDIKIQDFFDNRERSMVTLSKKASSMAVEILNIIDWGPDSHKIFSTTGCKRISQKVGLYAVRYRKGRANEEL